MRVFLKWVGIICLIPIVLVLLLSVLLCIPPFQNFVISKAVGYANQATGLDISVRRLRLTFPLKLTVEGMQVISPPADTLLIAERMDAHIKPIPLLRKEVTFHAFDLEQVVLNTDTLIDGVHARGSFNLLKLSAPDLNLNDEHVRINGVELSDADISVVLTTPQKEKADTVSAPVNWVIDLEKITFRKVDLALDMPESQLNITSYIDKADLSDGKVDLAQTVYTVNEFSLSNSSVRYNGNELQPTAGLDPMHLDLTDLNIKVQDILYSDTAMSARIESFTVQDRSGLVIRQLEGEIRSDSLTIEVPELTLQTGESELRLMASVPWSALDKEPQGNMRARLNGYVGKGDIIKVAGQLPENIRNSYPDRPLSIVLGADGTMNALHIQQLKADLPGAFSLNASGNINNLTDSIWRAADIVLSAETRDLSFVEGLLPDSTRQRIHIPPGIKLSGEVQLANREYRGRLLMTEARARINLNGRYNQASESYTADLKIKDLQPDHFLPQDSLFLLSATIQADGRGTDPYSGSTRMNVQGTIEEVQYASMHLTNVAITGSLAQHQAKIEVDSEDPNADLDLLFEGTFQKDLLKGSLTLDVDTLDLHGLHLIQDTIMTSFQMFAEVESNLKMDYLIDLTLGNWEITTATSRYNPKIVTLHAQTNEDTTRVSLHAGDLGVYLTGNADIQSMIGQFSTISTEINRQLQQDTVIHITEIRPLFPDMHLEITAGRDNPLYTYLSQSEIKFSELYVDGTTSPEDGLQLDAGLYGFMRDTLRIDTVQLEIRQDTAGLNYDVEVIKHRYRNQQPFSAGVAGVVRDNYVDAGFEFRNEKDSIGFLLGVRANKVAGGIRIQLFPDDPVLAYRDFQLNPDNYIIYRSKTDIEANVRFTGEKNASLWIHSSPESGTMEQLFAEISQLDLSSLSDIPGFPQLDGVLNASVRYEPEDSTFLVFADINIDTLFYNGGRVGEVTLNATYLPLGNGQQQVDLHMFRDQAEALSATGMYTSGTPDHISGTINLHAFPMAMVSPFVPDQMAEFSGTLNGEMTIEGSTQAPDLNGYLQMDTASIFVVPAGMAFRIDDQRIPVEQSLVTFNQWKIYGEGNNLFIIDGTVNLSQVSRIMTDLTLTADNMELLNSEHTSESLVYGRLLVSLNSTIQGPLNGLELRGDVHLLGGTNVTYVLTDSPLTVQDRLDGLVTFVSFADTVNLRPDRNQAPQVPAGMDMLISIQIDQSVQLNVDLTPDQSNHVEVTGGGDLTFQSTRLGDMVLNGRYTISEGTVSYTLPVVPLKDFSIHADSYVEFNGNPMNPTVNLTATERVRASVAGESGSRMVNFDVGIVVTGNLEDLSLDFTLAAPEDISVQNDLAGMGQEEVSKQAVGMLVTGRYLAGGGGSTNFDMGDALNTFLQNEIGNIAGDALKSVDISFDSDTYNDGGESRTDYSFRFSKRFYNGRIQVVIGGRVSTGSDLNTDNTQSFIDDVSVEYRLDETGTRFVRVFHDKNYESLLEGEIVETGVGLVLRKKMRYLKELFIFRKNKNKPVNDEKEVVTAR